MKTISFRRITETADARSTAESVASQKLAEQQWVLHQCYYDHGYQRFSVRFEIQIPDQITKEEVNAVLGSEWEFAPDLPRDLFIEATEAED